MLFNKKDLKKMDNWKKNNIARNNKRKINVFYNEKNLNLNVIKIKNEKEIEQFLYSKNEFEYPNCIYSNSLNKINFDNINFKGDLVICDIKWNIIDLKKINYNSDITIADCCNLFIFWSGAIELYNFEINTKLSLLQPL